MRHRRPTARHAVHLAKGDHRAARLVVEAAAQVHGVALAAQTALEVAHAEAARPEAGGGQDRVDPRTRGHPGLLSGGGVRRGDADPTWAGDPEPRGGAAGAAPGPPDRDRDALEHAPVAGEREL